MQSSRDRYSYLRNLVLMRDLPKDLSKFLQTPLLLPFRIFGNIKVRSFGEEMLGGVGSYLIQVGEM